MALTERRRRPSQRKAPHPFHAGQPDNRTYTGLLTTEPREKDIFHAPGLIERNVRVMNLAGQGQVHMCDFLNPTSCFFKTLVSFVFENMIANNFEVPALRTTEGLQVEREQL